MTTTLSIIRYETNEPSIPQPTQKLSNKTPPRPHPFSSILNHNNHFQFTEAATEAFSPFTSITTTLIPLHSLSPPIILNQPPHPPQEHPKLLVAPHSCICSSGLSSSSSSSFPSGPSSFSSGRSFSSPGFSSKMAGMVAVDPYVLLTFFVSLLGFLVLSVLRRRNYSKAKSKAQKNNNNTTNVPEKSINRFDDGEVPPVHGSGTDVLVVGAAVAGGALALTLAKVGKQKKRKKNEKAKFEFLLFYLFIGNSALFVYL